MEYCLHKAVIWSLHFIILHSMYQCLILYGTSSFSSVLLPFYIKTANLMKHKKEQFLPFPPTAGIYFSFHPYWEFRICPDISVHNQRAWRTIIP
jgi:hypothetical protein